MIIRKRIVILATVLSLLFVSEQSLALGGGADSEASSAWNNGGSASIEANGTGTICPPFAWWLEHFND